MKKKSILCAISLLATLSQAVELKFQGLDYKWFTISGCTETECQLKGEVDNKNLHFLWKGTISNGPATAKLATTLDKLEFAVGYFDEATEIKGQKHNFNTYVLKGLWDNSPVEIKGEFALAPSFAKDATAKESFSQTPDWAADYATVSLAEREEKEQSGVDNAVPSKWIKDIEKAPPAPVVKAVVAPVVVPVVAPVVAKPVVASSVAKASATPAKGVKAIPAVVAPVVPVVAAPVAKTVVVPVAKTPVVAPVVAPEAEVPVPEVKNPFKKVKKVEAAEPTTPVAAPVQKSSGIIPDNFKPKKEQKIPKAPAITKYGDDAE
jgi:hypothetical protein